jgi:hypothetical protein
MAWLSVTRCLSGNGGFRPRLGLQIRPGGTTASQSPRRHDCALQKAPVPVKPCKGAKSPGRLKKALSRRTYIAVFRETVRLFWGSSRKVNFGSRSKHGPIRRRPESFDATSDEARNMRVCVSILSRPALPPAAGLSGLVRFLRRLIGASRWGHHRRISAGVAVGAVFQHFTKTLKRMPCIFSPSH